MCFMCGRYTYFPREFSDLRLTWNVDEVFDLKPRFNIAPTQEAPVIVQAAGKRTLELFRWGLIPWWAKDPAIGNRMINARAETLAEKPAFNFKLKSGEPFTFAGLWDTWKQPDGNLLRTYRRNAWPGLTGSP